MRLHHDYISFVKIRLQLLFHVEIWNFDSMNMYFNYVGAKPICVLFAIMKTQGISSAFTYNSEIYLPDFIQTCREFCRNRRRGADEPAWFESAMERNQVEFSSRRCESKKCDGDQRERERKSIRKQIWLQNFIRSEFRKVLQY